MKKLLLAALPAFSLLALGLAPATQPTSECCTAGEVAMSEEAPATQPAGEQEDAQALFKQLKSLVGTWEGDAMGQKSTVTYALTGGGSAVMETTNLHGGMVTMFTLDGDRVVATHYCAAGNQPRMSAAGLADHKANFDFVDITGMASPAAPHMHNFTMAFSKDGTIDQAWTLYADGKAAHTVTIKLTKQK